MVAASDWTDCFLDLEWGAEAADVVSLWDPASVPASEAFLEGGSEGSSAAACTEAFLEGGCERSLAREVWSTEVFLDWSAAAGGKTAPL